MEYPEHENYHPLSSVLIAFALLASATSALGYPLDGYEETGIRRVEGARLANEGLAVGGFQPPGAMLTTEQVDLRLLGHRISPCRRQTLNLQRRSWLYSVRTPIDTALPYWI